MGNIFFLKYEKKQSHLIPQKIDFQIIRHENENDGQIVSIRGNGMRFEKPFTKPLNS